MKKEVSLDESKKIMLKILKSIDSFCRENNLNYSLNYGTLLGAVRHKGFIPWDDDVDLMMPRKDFDIFVNNYQDDKYDVLTNKDPNWGWNYLRICDKSTIVIFDSDSEKIKQHGLWVSIFPIDNVPDNKENWIKQKKQMNFYHNLSRLKRSGWTSGGGVIRNSAKFLFRWILKPIPLDYLAEKEKRIMCKYNSVKTKFVFVRVMLYHEIPSSFFEEFVNLEFENNMFMSIAKYDEYLKLEYDDYMQLPPKEQRVPIHGYKAYYKE